MPLDLNKLHDSIMELVTHRQSYEAVPTHQEIQDVAIHGMTPESANALPIEKLHEYIPKIKSVEQRLKEQGINVPKGLLPAIFMQESSAGTVNTSYNPDIGEKAWTVGLTKGAVSELQKNGFTPDLSSDEGAFEAAGRYWDLRSKVYDYDPKTDTKTLNPKTELYAQDPALAYQERYYGGDKPVAETFKKKLQYYANSNY